MLDEPGRYPWLRRARYWLTIVTYVTALIAVAFGLTRIDSVVTSGSDDWHAHAMTLMLAFGSLVGAATIFVSGRALVDFIRLAIDCESQLRGQATTVREIIVRSRRLTSPVAAPSSSSREILSSLGIARGMRSPTTPPDTGTSPLTK